MTLPLCVLGAGAVHGLCVAALLPMLVTLPAAETSKPAPTIVHVDVVAPQKPIALAEPAPRPAIELAPGMEPVANVPPEPPAETRLGDAALTTASLPETPAPAAAEPVPSEAPPPPSVVETEPAAEVEPVKIEPVSTASQPQPVVPEQEPVRQEREPVTAEVRPMAPGTDPITKQSTAPISEVEAATAVSKDGDATHSRGGRAEAPVAEPIPAAETANPEEPATVAKADPIAPVPAALQPPPDARPVSAKRPVAQTGQAKPRANSPPKVQAQPVKAGAAAPVKRKVARARRPVQSRVAQPQVARGGMFRLFAGPTNTTASAARRNTVPR